MKIREKRRSTQNKGVSIKIRETWPVCPMHSVNASFSLMGNISISYSVIFLYQTRKPNFKTKLETIFVIFKTEWKFYCSRHIILTWKLDVLENCRLMPSGARNSQQLFRVEKTKHDPSLGKNAHVWQSNKFKLCCCI